MKEIGSILNSYKSIDLSKTKAALATLVRVEGSSYRKTGARMLVLENGVYYGGISGGCLEGDALRRAQKAIIQNRPSLVTYDTTQDDGSQIGLGMGCVGIIDVLFVPLQQDDENNPVELLAKKIVGARVPKAIVSVIMNEEKLPIVNNTIVYENDEQFLRSFAVKEIAGDVLADVRKALDTRKSSTDIYIYKDEKVKIFIEVILPITQMVIYGGNNDIYPLIGMAREMGWEVTVVTNINKVDKTLFSCATRVLHNKGEEQPLLDEYTAAVLMAHDYKRDHDNLEQMMLTKVNYIGVLGSKRRSQLMFEALASKDPVMLKNNLPRIYAPAGLDIGSASPEGIALSIVAEIHSHFAKRNGMSLRLGENYNAPSK